MHRYFMLGMLTVSVCFLAVALAVCLGVTKADGPTPQYVYQISVDPVKGGPTLLATEYNVTQNALKVRTIFGDEVCIIDIPVYIVRSAEKLNVELLAQKLKEPILQTQEASK